MTSKRIYMSIDCHLFRISQNVTANLLLCLQLNYLREFRPWDFHGWSISMQVHSLTAEAATATTKCITPSNLALAIIDDHRQWWSAGGGDDRKGGWVFNYSVSGSIIIGGALWNDLFLIMRRRSLWSLDQLNEIRHLNTSNCDLFYFTSSIV